jgi:thymidylate kinase
MKLKKTIIDLVGHSIGSSMPFLVLRGADEMARPDGDLDFIVPEGQAIHACKLVTEEALKNGFYLIGYRNIGYLAQIILVNPTSSNHDEVIKIDFFDGVRWYGVGLDSLGKKIFSIHENKSNLDSRFVGAVSFIQKILTVGRVSSRDWNRYTSTGADSKYLSDFTNQIGIPSIGKHIGKNGVSFVTKWRLRAASGGVSGPLSVIPWIIKIIFQHAAFKLRAGSNPGLLVGVSGPDGSGKSTVISRLESAYKCSGIDAPLMVHLLPSWIPMPHQIFRRKATKKNYTRPYSEPPVSSNISGGLRLGYYLLAFSITKVWTHFLLKRGKNIIFDRSLLDFMADLGRSKIPNYKIPVLLIKLLLPKGIMFFLDANPDVVVSRKGELTHEKACALRSSYTKVGRSVNAVFLDGNQAAHTVYSQFLGKTSERYIYLINSACAKHKSNAKQN